MLQSENQFGHSKNKIITTFANWLPHFPRSPLPFPPELQDLDQCYVLPVSQNASSYSLLPPNSAVLRLSDLSTGQLALPLRLASPSPTLLYFYFSPSSSAVTLPHINIILSSCLRTILKSTIIFLVSSYRCPLPAATIFPPTTSVHSFQSNNFIHIGLFVGHFLHWISSHSGE